MTNTNFHSYYYAVLTRQFTCAELLAPGAPFIKKVLTVNIYNYFLTNFIPA